MIDMGRALRHLAWADAKMFDELAALPPEALQARYTADRRSVAELATHIVGGAEWYCYCLAGTPWTDLQVPTDAADLAAMRAHILDLDAVLLREAEQSDDVVSLTDEYGDKTAHRSTILAQACMHATEHRAQIACALEVSGYPGMTLDDYDVWAFEAAEG